MSQADSDYSGIGAPVGTIAEQLKEMADEVGARALRATIPTGRDQWVTVEVRYASLFSESPDGWDVEVEEGEI